MRPKYKELWEKEIIKVKELERDLADILSYVKVWRCPVCTHLILWNHSCNTCKAYHKRCKP